MISVDNYFESLVLAGLWTKPVSIFHLNGSGGDDSDDLTVRLKVQATVRIEENIHSFIIFFLFFCSN